MNKILPRYRVRMEWNGIELFDREEGRVISLDTEAKDFLFEICSQKEPISYLISSNLPSQLESLYFVKNNAWNVEPLINTAYPKTSSYASAPRRIYWEFTRKCNLNCKACFNRFFTDQEELSLESVIKIASGLYKAGVYEIRCTGGEPTVRPDFFEIVQELKNIGFYLSMGSNGIYSKNILEKVLQAPIDWIIISIDGSDEKTNSEIRGKGRLKKVLETLEHLSHKKNRFRINTLIRKIHYKYTHLKPLAQICEKFNIESLNCIPLRPLTNDPNILKLQLSPVEFQEFICGLNRLRQEFKTDFVTTLDLRHTELHDRIYFKDRSCAAGREGAVISPYGEIYGCSYSLASIPDAPRDKRKLYVAGNLVEEDFLEIWNQSERWAIYRDLEKYKHENCMDCEYYTTRRCIGNCPIMIDNDPAAFDPYCYLFLENNHLEKE